MEERLIKGVEEMHSLAAEIAAQFKPAATATILALSGDLGSGKTTFTQGLARTLGVADPVTSPTFVIEKIYRLEDQQFSHLIHIDCYRLANAGELQHLGWQEIATDPANIICIEWPEQVQPLVQPTISLAFKFIDEQTRSVTISHA